MYFVSLPGWFITALCYIGLSKVMQRNVVPHTAAVPS